MTGALARNEADVAVTIMAQCCDREKVRSEGGREEMAPHNLVRFQTPDRCSTTPSRSSSGGSGSSSVSRSSRATSTSFRFSPERAELIFNSFVCVCVCVLPVLMLSQFSNELWLFILLTVAALQLTMGLIIWYNLAVMKRASHAEFDFKDNLSWSLCTDVFVCNIFQSVSILCHFISWPAFVAQQGYERDPKRSSQRVLFFSGFVFSMLVFIAFSANIIAILSQTRSIDTFQALLDYEPIKMVVSAFPYFQVKTRTRTVL